MDKQKLINSLFFPRNINVNPDDKDHLVIVDNDIEVGVRFFINNKNSPNILYLHGNGEIAHEYEDIASYYNQYGINLLVSDYRGYGLSLGSPTKNNLLSDSLLIFD